MIRVAEEPRFLSLPEALDRLLSPYALEEFAPLTGDGVLVVDLPVEDRRAPATTRVEAAAEALSELACPTVALAPADPSPAAAALMSAFDVVLPGDAAGLESILARIRARPRAALALVQLLRHNAELSIHEGLIAESLVYSTLQAGPEFAEWLETHSPTPSEETGEPAVQVERVDATLFLTLNRPARHNAFGVALRDGLVEGLQLAVWDEEIEEIVLAGAGPSFSSGGDLDEFGTFPDPATAHTVRSIRNPGRLLARLADRCRARVHGACIGAGVELPAFVSRVSAAPDAFFQLPELAMGLVPGAGGTVSLPRRIGRQRTAWLALGGERIDAETALDWGLIDRIESDAAAPRAR
ncbi:MAG: enoyl-CoA hydratase/isomerase family protein [Myxococcota bacterium]|nr:enoyl-CoA hydratase/isomerase family protein [Myxococcota bacterium]